MRKERIRPVPNSTTPYWRTELHWLDEHRSTLDLPTNCDIVVIGAGMSGVAFIYHLLKLYGEEPIPSITLLEARQVCSGATGRNGGHVKVRSTTMQNVKEQHGLEAAETLAAFVAGQIGAMKDVVETEGLDCEFELRRSFDVFLDDADAQSARKHFENSVANRERWIRDVSVVPQKYIEQITSIVGAKYALSMPACSFWPYKFVTTLLETFIDRINLQTNTLVTDVLSTDHGYDVCTTRGVVRAKKVIFASNGYTGGICPAYHGTIVPYKGCNSYIAAKHHDPPSPHLSNTYNIGYSTHVDYLNPRPTGGITVGGANGFFSHDKSLWLNNWDDSKLFPGISAYFDGYMQRRFKGWEDSDAAADQIWVGIMGQTPDAFPHIGKVVGQSGQYIMAGFNGGGMAMIFLAAQGLAKICKDNVQFAATGLPPLFETSASRFSKNS